MWILTGPLDNYLVRKLLRLLCEFYAVFLSESEVREKTSKKAKSTRKSQIARDNPVTAAADTQEQVDSSGNRRRSSTSRKQSLKEERMSLTDNPDDAGALAVVAAVSEAEVTVDVGSKDDIEQQEEEAAAKAMPPPKGCCIVM